MKKKNIITLVLIIIILIALVSIIYYLLNKPKETIIINNNAGKGMLIAECSNTSYIAETSNYIIEGTIDKVESKWNENKTLISTYSDIKIEKVIKGNIVEQNLVIITSGGTVGGITQNVEDQPILHEGKSVRIYAEKINNEYSIICGINGIQEITNPTPVTQS